MKHTLAELLDHYKAGMVECTPLHGSREQTLLNPGVVGSREAISDHAGYQWRQLSSGRTRWTASYL